MLKVPRRWENRPQGALPGFVHDFYNHPERRTPESAQRVVAELLRRNRNLIDSHLERFKAERISSSALDRSGGRGFAFLAPVLQMLPVSTGSVSDAWLRQAAVAGATKAILTAKSPYEIQARFTNSIHGALARSLASKGFRLGGGVRNHQAAARIRMAFENLVWPQSLERVGTLTRSSVLSELHSPRTPRGPQRKVLRRLFRLPKPSRPFRDVVFSQKDLARYAHPDAVESILRQLGIDMRGARSGYEQPTLTSLAASFGVSKQNVSALAKKGLARISKTVQARRNKEQINRFLDPQTRVDENHPGVAAFLRYHQKTLRNALTRWKSENKKTHPWRAVRLEALDPAVVQSALMAAVKEVLFDAKNKGKPFGTATGMVVSKVVTVLNGLAGVKRGPQPRPSGRAVSCWVSAASARKVVTERYRDLETRAEQLAFLTGLAPERNPRFRFSYGARRRTSVRPIKGQRVLGKSKRNGNVFTYATVSPRLAGIRRRVPPGSWTFRL